MSKSSKATACLVIEGAEVYAPAALGTTSVVAAGGRTLWLGNDAAQQVASLDGVRHMDARGLRLIPGLIDQHIHFVGGGDANGPQGRVEELTARQLLSAGTTTAVGLLGVDNETRDLRLLLRKAHELRAEGVTAFIYTGGMPLPARHLLDSVCADVSFIDQVIGAKSAVAERLHPNRDWNDLADLAGQVMRARAMSGKRAVLHCHVGSLDEALAPLFRLVDELQMPIDQIVPTHVNRTPDFSTVFEEAIAFALRGGTIDMTCCVSRLDGNLTGVDVPDALRICLERGVPLAQVTVSTDGNIPAAVRDAHGKLTGYRTVPPSVLFRDLMRMVDELGLPLDQALQPMTTNVARVLGLDARKGRVAPGFDADYVLIDQSDLVHTVIAGGAVVFQQ